MRDASGIDAAVIDLFAAETANLCGELVSLFGPWLPPAWLAAMQQRVVARMVQPFLADPDAFGWSHQPSNWNAVCHQGLLGAALALAPEAPWLDELVETSRRHLQLFLDGFSAQGSCLEGITYWEYGFGWFALLNEQLELWSGGAQSLVDGQEERMRAIARFGPAMLLRGRQLVSFADSRLDMPPRGSVLMLLGRRLELPECTQAGVQLWRAVQSALNRATALDPRLIDKNWRVRREAVSPWMWSLWCDQPSHLQQSIGKAVGIQWNQLDPRAACYELPSELTSLKWLLREIRAVENERGEACWPLKINATHRTNHHRALGFKTHQTVPQLDQEPWGVVGADQLLIQGHREGGDPQLSIGHHGGQPVVLDRATELLQRV